VRSSGTTSITFLGAAGTVTGSRFLVETGTSRVLVECGLFQGLKENRLRNWEPFPVDAESIDAVVVTHAHVDHIGYLPRLVRQGFRGPVVCTERTADLAAIVLPDSGHLHEEDAARANRGGWSKHRPALPLYTEADARAALPQLRAATFDTTTSLTENLAVTLQPAGHILGSATVTLEEAGTGMRTVFSGDLGRPYHPLLVPPAPPGRADVVVMESTYGARRHDEGGAIARLGRVVERTAARGGTVLIPAFAVDRTEVVLFHLRSLVRSGAAPDLPIYVDSPMALRTLDVYRRAIAAGDVDVRASLHGASDPFDTGQVHEIRRAEDSKTLADAPVPSIIVSASGMATGGRVLHHLARALPDPRNSVVLVGFQAAGTRGRRLADGCTELKMLGRSVPVRADVDVIDAFSVHADRRELLDWLGAAPDVPGQIFVVHGENAASESLRAAIESELAWPARVPRFGQRALLSTS
jgi:metallo-beta-lactamase family protein